MFYLKKISAILLMFAFVCALCGVVCLFNSSCILQGLGVLAVCVFAFKPMYRLFVQLIAFCLVFACLVSCHTMNTITDNVSCGTMEHEKVIYKTDIQHDSIYVYDTKNVYLKGDTIVQEVEKYKYLYKYVYKHDTINEATHDTITEYKTIIKSVEKKDTFVEKLTLCSLMALMLLFFVAVGLLVLRKELKNNINL